MEASVEHEETPSGPSGIVLGNLDGVHIGHRALVRLAVETCRRENLTANAVIFDPHPAQVLAPERAPRLLTTIARRRELLETMGIERIVALPFDRAFAELEPEAFAQAVLAGQLRAQVVVVGRDFRFGRRRRGDAALLAKIGAQCGYRVLAIEDVTLDEMRVSSTAVRQALERGDVTLAAKLLGRVHDADGRVAHGDGRGRTLGFPTANLEMEDVVLPTDGVYAVAVRAIETPSEGTLPKRCLGVANLGTRPTFGAGRALEVHLFDVAGSFYGAKLRVGFVARLRSEERFAGPSALAAQIAKDVAAGRARSAETREEDLAWM